MIWIFDVRKQVQNPIGYTFSHDKAIFQQYQLQISGPKGVIGDWDSWAWETAKKFGIHNSSRIREIEWKWPKKVILNRQSPTYLDLGEPGLLRLVDFVRYYNRGIGVLGNRQEFIDWLQDQ